MKRVEVGRGDVNPNGIPVPNPHEQEGDYACTHCGGEGLCWDGADPLGNCPDEPHRCHACNGSGNGEDQTIF